MAPAIEQFKTYIHAQGLRYTPERELIVRGLMRMGRHFAVDELFSYLRRQHPAVRIAKASLYRNLDHFIAAGLIERVSHEEGRYCYERTAPGEHHDHMRCVCCGRVFEFMNGTIEKLQEKVCAEHEVTMVWHKLEMGVVCRRCCEIQGKSLPAGRQGKKKKVTTKGRGGALP